MRTVEDPSDKSEVIQTFCVLFLLICPKVHSVQVLASCQQLALAVSSQRQLASQLQGLCSIKHWWEFQGVPGLIVRNVCNSVYMEPIGPLLVNLYVCYMIKELQLMLLFLLAQLLLDHGLHSFMLTLFWAIKVIK